MKFNEDSRVKIPTILHLVRLGYTYLSLKGQEWDHETNIFKDIFTEAIGEINNYQDHLNLMFNESRDLELKIIEEIKTLEYDL